MSLIPFRPDFRPVGPTGTFFVPDYTKPYQVGWRAILPEDLNVTVKVTSFNISSGYALLGTGVRPFFTMTYNRPVSGAIVVCEGTGGIRNVTGLNFGSLFWGTGTFTKSNFGESVQFTIIASGHNYYNQGRATGYITWVNNNYFGSAASGTINSNFIQGLSNKTLSPHHSGYYEGVTVSGQYVWYAARASGGHPTFIDLSNNIRGGFTLVSSGQMFTNEAGAAEPFCVYRSNNDSLGFSRFIATTGDTPWRLM